MSEILRGVKCTVGEPNKLAQIHNNAIECEQIEQSFGGDLVRFHCPNCDLKFEVELPE